MAREYSEPMTILVFNRGTVDDPDIGYACLTHVHNPRECRGRHRCLACWLDDDVSNVGAGELFWGDFNVTFDPDEVHRIRGRLWSEKYESYDGTDYDAGWEMAEDVKMAASNA